MICLTVHIIVKAGHEHDTDDMFRSSVQLVPTDPGCMRFHVLESRKEPRKFMLYELYRDDTALDAHRRTPHFLDYTPKMQDLTEQRESELFTHIA